MEDQGVVMLDSNFEPYSKNCKYFFYLVVFGANVAVGKDNFEIIIRDRLTFVNKLMLIKEFIESSNLVLLILCPRKFGKSTNLSILNRFFKIPYSQEENVICSQLFEKLKISAKKKIMQNHFAQYPIIHISLKGNDKDIAKAMLVENYIDKFGFTSDEIELLLSLQKNLQINDVQKWYDGYISGESTHLYNLQSIICLLSRGILGAYWSDTGSTQKLEKYSAIWTLLYYAGYLTMNSEKHFVISNEEICSEWHNWVINVPFFTQGQTIISMLNNLLHGNLDLFSKEFERVFANARDQGFIVHFNHEASFGRFDIKIVSKPGVNKMAIIIEFKAAHDKKSLYDMAQEGLLQIEEKQYQVDLEENVKKLTFGNRNCI
ncbi:DUF1703-domain-containing protein [Gigaspora margarita]|uniref:DUF1703-domain-containing protein n=1 Tax=Gigaspora margarita TaxID=4874 RepID=A0A8H4B250_GIGMA|nr:DUF1703-domain-containing protein [Gigaspora margarita]